MGCHPSHWLSYFSRWLKPPTRISRTPKTSLVKPGWLSHVRAQETPIKNFTLAGDWTSQWRGRAVVRWSKNGPFWDKVHNPSKSFKTHGYPQVFMIFMISPERGEKHLNRGVVSFHFQTRGSDQTSSQAQWPSEEPSGVAPCRSHWGSSWEAWRVPSLLASWLRR